MQVQRVATVSRLSPMVQVLMVAHPLLASEASIWEKAKGQSQRL